MELLLDIFFPWAWEPVQGGKRINKLGQIYLSKIYSVSHRILQDCLSPFQEHLWQVPFRTCGWCWLRVP